jgi:hypothetical protein
VGQGNTIFFSNGCIDSDNDDGTRRLSRPSGKTKAPKYVTYYLPTFSSRMKRAAVSAPTPQQPDAPTSFRRQELRRERPTRRSRPARHMPHFHRPIHGARCGPRRALRLVVILASDRLVRASRDGGQRHTWRPQQRRRCTDVASTREPDEPNAYEVLQNFFNSLSDPNDCGKPWDAVGESWCYDCEWEATSDGAEDVEWECWGRCKCECEYFADKSCRCS